VEVNDGKGKAGSDDTMMDPDQTTLWTRISRVGETTNNKKDKSEHREEALKKPHTKLECIKTPENSNCPVVPPPLFCPPLILSSIYPSISTCPLSLSDEREREREREPIIISPFMLSLM